MLKFTRNLIFLSVLSTVSGCQYDRSFMQMDSNSGVPFFGLQWAVDSGARPGSAGDLHGLETLRIDERSDVFLPGQKTLREKLPEHASSTSLVSLRRPAVR